MKLVNSVLKKRPLCSRLIGKMQRTHWFFLFIAFSLKFDVFEKNSDHDRINNQEHMCLSR